jgi:drug/metabolite transporter (DMT)-like permease
MPWVFVLLWSTGFVVARFAMPHSPPLSFLSLRYALSLLCLLVWIGLARAVWPARPVQWLHLGVVGMLIHAGYLGGVWAAIKHGIGAGTVALLVGLQPVLTALWIAAGNDRATSRRITSRQWLGLLLGFGGLALVVWHKLGSGEVTVGNLVLGVFALLCITAGTLYQKRFVTPCDVRTAGAVQLAAALIVTLPLARLEPAAIEWQPELIGALAWSVLALTLGANSLLYLMLQRGAATVVASLMYLVPPCTALLARMLFGESFTLLMAFGMALTVSGVALVVRAPTR